MIKPKDYVIDKLGWDKSDCHVIPIKTHSLFFDHFCYLDTKDYMADQLFEDAGLKVRFGKEYASPEAEYVFVFCKCRKRDRAKFLETIHRLPAKAILLGHKDYMDVCKNVIRTIYMQGNNKEDISDDRSGLPDEEIPSILISFLEDRKEELLQQVEQSIDDYIFDVLQFIISDPYGESDPDNTETETNTAEENGSE